jgi:hypothetical protein
VSARVGAGGSAFDAGLRSGPVLARVLTMAPKRTFLACAAAATVLLSVAIPFSSAQTMGDKLRLTAFAVNLNARAGAATNTVEITIDRWTPDAERQKLIQTLIDKGSDALLEELRDQRPVGRIRTPDSLGYDLRFSYEGKAEDGGQRIVVATDRPLSFWEAVNRPRSFDYPFTVIEIHVNKDGTGEGKMSLATKITAVGDTIALENYQIQPVQLKSVRAEKQN